MNTNKYILFVFISVVSGKILSLSSFIVSINSLKKNVILNNVFLASAVLFTNIGENKVNDLGYGIVVIVRNLLHKKSVPFWRTPAVESVLVESTLLLTNKW